MKFIYKAMVAANFILWGTLIGVILFAITGVI